MKKLERSNFFTELPYCTLYLDDIEQIIEIVKTQLSDVVFRDLYYEYESINEAKERIGSRSGNFQIVVNGATQEDNLFELSIHGRTIALRVNPNHELLWHQVTQYKGASTLASPRFRAWLVCFADVFSNNPISSIHA